MACVHPALQSICRSCRTTCPTRRATEPSPHSTLPRTVWGITLPMDTAPQKFAAALDALVEQVKRDRSILAAILCGSLSHDTVWAKSDIDLVLVTIDDRKTNDEGLSL